MKPAEMAEAVADAKDWVRDRADCYLCGVSGVSPECTPCRSARALIESQRQVAALTKERNAAYTHATQVASDLLDMSRRCDAATLRAERVSERVDMLESQIEVLERERDEALATARSDWQALRPVVETAERVRVVEEIAAWHDEQYESERDAGNGGQQSAHERSARFIRAEWGTDRDTKPDNTIGARHTIAELRAALVEACDWADELNGEVHAAYGEMNDVASAAITRLRTLAGPVVP